MLGYNDGSSLPEISPPIFRLTKEEDDESEMQLSENHRHVHEAASVELMELNNHQIADDFAPESDNASNTLYGETDFMDEIWESKQSFGSGDFSARNHHIQSESKWYVPANEVEVREAFVGYFCFFF